jgi:hypothetical protein
MSHSTPLDKQWDALMALCQQEVQLQGENHPRLLRFVSGQIDALAREMGFSEKRIERREFRAQRRGRHIVQVSTD